MKHFLLSIQTLPQKSQSRRKKNIIFSDFFLYSYFLNIIKIILFFRIILFLIIIYPEFMLCRRRIMKPTTIIVFAFVIFILDEPTSALPRRDEGRCPNRVCQNDNFLSCCESYGSYYNKNSCKIDKLQPYLFYCCPNHDYKGCLDMF